MPRIRFIATLEMPRIRFIATLEMPRIRFIATIATSFRSFCSFTLLNLDVVALLAFSCFLRNVSGSSQFQFIVRDYTRL
jgi:hypothetical protein